MDEKENQPTSLKNFYKQYLQSVDKALEFSRGLANEVQNTINIEKNKILETNYDAASQKLTLGSDSERRYTSYKSQVKQRKEYRFSNLETQTEKDDQNRRRDNERKLADDNFNLLIKVMKDDNQSKNQKSIPETDNFLEDHVPDPLENGDQSKQKFTLPIKNNKFLMDDYNELKRHRFSIEDEFLLYNKRQSDGCLGSQQKYSKTNDILDEFGEAQSKRGLTDFDKKLLEFRKISTSQAKSYNDPRVDVINKPNLCNSSLLEQQGENILQILEKMCPTQRNQQPSQQKILTSNSNLINNQYFQQRDCDTPNNFQVEGSTVELRTYWDGDETNIFEKGEDSLKTENFNNNLFSYMNSTSIDTGGSTSRTHCATRASHDNQNQNKKPNQQGVNTIYTAKALQKQAGYKSSDKENLYFNIEKSRNFYEFSGKLAESIGRIEKENIIQNKATPVQDSPKGGALQSPRHVKNDSYSSKNREAKVVKQSNQNLKQLNSLHTLFSSQCYSQNSKISANSVMTSAPNNFKSSVARYSIEKNQKNQEIGVKSPSCQYNVSLKPTSPEKVLLARSPNVLKNGMNRQSFCQVSKGSPFQILKQSFNSNENTTLTERMSNYSKMNIRASQIQKSKRQDEQRQSLNNINFEKKGSVMMLNLRSATNIQSNNNNNNTLQFNNNNGNICFNNNNNKNNSSSIDIKQKSILANPDASYLKRNQKAEKKNKFEKVKQQLMKAIWNE